MTRVKITITREFTNDANAERSLDSMKKKIPKEWTVENYSLQG